MAKLIEQMSHDDRVDLVRRLDPEVAEGLLRLVDEADRRDIATLVSYPENTVGAMMTTDYAWLPETITAETAIDRLRQQAPDRETIYGLGNNNDVAKITTGTLVWNGVSDGVLRNSNTAPSSNPPPAVIPGGVDT